MEVKYPLLQMKGINKSFYGVPVLKNIDFDLDRGQCIGLIGENGAGKSTLIKILCGAYQKDGGTILVDGNEVSIESVEDAQKLGIRTIYQELSLFPTMSVEENVFINNEKTLTKAELTLAPLDIKEMRAEASRILRDVLSSDLDVTKKIEEIPFSQRQLVEIARAIYSNGQIIIMDEPTTALENKEKEKLFQVIRDLKSKDKTVVFISHHLDEVMTVCDRTVVLRDGEVALNKNVSETNIDEIIHAMVGKAVDNHYPKVEQEIGDVVLKVEHLSSGKLYKDVTFDVREREIVGIAGLAGCGKNEILRSLFGLVKRDGGAVTYKGRELALKNAEEAMKDRFAFLPAERKTEGIFSIQPVSWNTTISALDKIKRLIKLQPDKEIEITNGYIRDLGIKVHSPKQLISRLSGGNQQKIMLSRWFMTDPEVLLLEEPTRGIDVNAKVDVYNLIMQYVSKGNSVVMVSSEEDELLGICDRIVVVHNGEIVATLNAKDTSVEEIKRYSVNAAEKG